MILDFQAFMQLSEELKKQYLNFDRVNLSSYLKKGFAYLSDAELETLFNIKKLDEQAYQFAGQLSSEITKILPQLTAIADAALNNKLDDIRKPVIEIFSFIFNSSFNIIANNLNDGLKNGDSMLLGGLLASSVADILETVLKFEKKIDTVYPNASSMIINAVGSAITMTLAVQFPAAAVAFKASGITEYAKDFLNCDNLEKSIEHLRKKTTEVKNDPKLAPMLEDAEVLSKSSLDTGLKLSTLQLANLSKEEITATSKIPQNDSYKQLAKELNQQADKIPLSKEMAQRQMNDIKTAIDKIIDNSGLAPAKEAKQNLDQKMHEATEIIAETITKDQTILQKIYSSHLAVNKIKEFIPSNISKDIKESLHKNIDKVIDKQLALFGAALTEGIKKSPPLAKQLGLSKVMELSIQKLSLQKETTRAR